VSTNFTTWAFVEYFFLNIKKRAFVIPFSKGVAKVKKLFIPPTSFLCFFGALGESFSRLLAPSPGLRAKLFNAQHFMRQR